MITSVTDLCAVNQLTKGMEWDFNPVSMLFYVERSIFNGSIFRNGHGNSERCRFSI